MSLAATPNRVLIVDDNPADLQGLSALLQQMDLKIFVATTGETALARAEQAEPDLILLNVVMPDMDGFEICRRLKTSPQTEAVPVIFVMPPSDVEQKARGFEVGGADYLSKPWQLAEVVARVKHQLQLRQLTRRLEAEIETHRQQEAALRRSETRFRTLIDALPFGVWMRDAADRLIMQNPVDVARYGDQLGTVGAADLAFTPEQLALYEEAKQHCRQGQVWQYQTAELLGGEPHTYLRLLAPMPDLEGGMGTVGTAIDITERHRAVTQLQASEARFRTIFDSAFQFMGLFSLNGEVIEANQTALKFGGVTPADVVGTPLWETLWFQALPDSQALLQQAFAAAAQGEFSRFETRVMGQGDIILDIDVTIKPIFDENGHVYQILGDGRDISERVRLEAERQRTEQSLEQSRQALLTAQRVAHLGNWRCEAATGKVTWSEEMFRIFGFDPAQPEPAYPELQAVLHPDDRETYGQIVHNALTTGEPFETDLRLQRRDGSIRWITAKGEAARDDQGQITGLFGTVLDITRLKQAEEELKQREALFRSLFEQDAVAMAIVAPNHQFLQMNRRCCEFFGDDEAALKSLTFRELTHPEDWVNSVAALTHLAEGKINNISMEKRYIRQGGTVVWSNTTIAAVRDQGGNLLYCHVLLEDISDRKHLETELQQSQAFLRSIYEGTAVGIGVLEVCGEDQYRYIDANPAIARIAGVPDGFLKGKTLEDLRPFFTPEGYAHLLAQYRLCVTTKESRQFEVSTTVDGQEVWWLTEINPLINGEGQVTELIASMFSISDRKRAEQALQHLNAELEQRVRERTQALLDSQTELKIKEAQYRSIFETVGEGIFINDLDTGALVEVNPAACQMHGYGRDAFLLVPPTTYIHPDSHGVFAKFIDALNQGQSFTGAAKGVRKDGSVFDAEVTGKRIFFNGKYHALGTVRDVTERNVSARNQQRLVSLIENSQDFTGISTFNYEPLFLNAAGLSLVGLSSIEEMQTYRLQDFFFPEDWGKLDQILALLAEVGDWHGEFRLRHFKTGESIDIEASLYRAGGQNLDDPLCVAVSARDIRDRKQGERDRQNLISLIENSSDFIGISTLDCEPLFLNAAGIALVGLDSIAEMQTYRLTDFFFPEDLPALEAQINQLSGRGRWEGEFRMRHFKTGAALDIEVRLYLLGSGEAEDPLCVAAVARDISDRKQAEAELQQLNAELEQRVVDRTAELQTAKESAEAANQAKSIFLANMSHELRTPLNAILGFAQLLMRDRDLAPQHQEQLGIINRSGEHLLALINDILEMSKIEAGGITLNPVHTDLYALLDSLEDMLRFKAQTKGITLRFERQSSVPQYLVLDQNKLRQVLINLLGNAIKFTQVGHVVLRVTADAPATDSDAPVIQFGVEDTGPGIAPAEIDLLFQPFVQAQAGRQSHQGTGLGLPISQKFIQMMGGEITLTSALGAGSTFAFTLPAQPTSREAVPPRTRAPQVLSLAPNQPRWRILIAEDHPPSRALLVQLLSDIGCEIRTADNGAAALDLWQQWQPHLIWMDIRMPGMDGYEATGRIRAMEREGAGREGIRSKSSSTHTVILALTANTFAEEREKALAAGCDDFVRKPLEAAIIFAKMAEHLGMQYVYADESPIDESPILEAPTVPAAGLTVAQLATMPISWLQQLYQCAAEVDDDKLAVLCTTIPERQVELKQTLLAMAQNFDFEPIMDSATAAIAQRRQSH